VAFAVGDVEQLWVSGISRLISPSVAAPMLTGADP